MALPAYQPADALQEGQQYLTFSAGGETFALGILHIKEIIEYSRVTRVPMMPGFIVGVLNLRGRVVPVIDLAARLGREASQVHKRSCIVIVEIDDAEDGQRRDLGLLVDGVSAVLEIHEVEPPPSFGARVRTDFIRGMGKLDEHFVVILEPACVLSVEEMAQLARLADQRPALPQLPDAR